MNYNLKVTIGKTLTILGAVLLLGIQYFASTVQSDAKLSKSLDDLSHLRNELLQYEEKSGRIIEGKGLKDIFPSGFQSRFTDPWGKEYQLNPTDGIIYSLGPESNTQNKAGWITSSFRPSLSIYNVEVGSTEEKRIAFSRSNDANGFLLRLHFSRAIFLSDSFQDNSSAIASAFAISAIGPDYNNDPPRIQHGLSHKDARTIQLQVLMNSVKEIFCDGSWILDVKNGNAIHLRVLPGFFRDRLGSPAITNEEIRFRQNRIEHCSTGQ